MNASPTFHFPDWPALTKSGVGVLVAAASSPSCARMNHGAMP